jgi:hypothetical protein
MPWTQKQVNLFRAAAHDPAIAASHGMTPAKAGEMAAEGVKAVAPIQRGRGQQMAALLKKK